MMNTNVTAWKGLPDTARSSTAAPEPKTVYIIDDDVAAGDSLAFCLQTLGYDPQVFNNGPQFLAGLYQREPGCILLDLAIPQMSGFDIIEAIADRLEVLPVIVITGRGDVASAVRAMKLGATDFIEKPYEEAILIEAMERVFAELYRHLASTYAIHDATRRLAKLSLGEKQVLQQIAAGLREPLIGHRMNLSMEELREQVASALAKLETPSMPEALQIVYLGGLNVHSSVAFAA